jgi:hypothetical protein
MNCLTLVSIAQTTEITQCFFVHSQLIMLNLAVGCVALIRLVHYTTLIHMKFVTDLHLLFKVLTLVNFKIVVFLGCDHV